MTLVAHSSLPAFERLRGEGHEVTQESQAAAGRGLHVGLLNIMPDAALEATERQFMRLLATCNRNARLYLYPFTVEGLPRGETASRHIAAHYHAFDDLRRDGLHAMVITGANVTEADITRERFFEPLMEVAAWGWESVPSVLCSCLAAHCVWKRYHDIDRTHLDAKRWGVFSHRTAAGSHPVLRDVNTRFDVPHSRFNDVPRTRIEAAGMRVLVHSEEAGVLLATSPDGFRYMYFQGHPEYETRSLLKEYKREVFRYLNGERPDYPPNPDHYLPDAAVSILADYRKALTADRERAEFPESRLEAHLDNTWSDSGKALFQNWIGLVYDLAAADRKGLFRPGVDARNPLGLVDAKDAGAG